MKSADYWINHLNLTKHPEGGYFKESYRATESVEGEHLPPRFTGSRAFSTAIYFLLTGNECSRFHRIKSDEGWHFYTGSGLTIYIIDKTGKLSSIKLGDNPDAGEVFQAVVPAECWFGAVVNDPGAYTLVGCTVSPGFDFHDFELADRTPLIAQYPEHREIIKKLTK
ncbi:MAG: cupin domain-containing protein [Desulfobulbaceae bacterium]|nr:cupin domain-containing protein [Desulfobulbaceae bacterium]